MSRYGGKTANYHSNVFSENTQSVKAAAAKCSGRVPLPRLGRLRPRTPPGYGTLPGAAVPWPAGSSRYLIVRTKRRDGASRADRGGPPHIDGQGNWRAQTAPYAGLPQCIAAHSFIALHRTGRTAVCRAAIYRVKPRFGSHWSVLFGDFLDKPFVFFVAGLY